MREWIEIGGEDNTSKKKQDKAHPLQKIDTNKIVNITMTMDSQSRYAVNELPNIFIKHLQ